jgi:hypothetical protein
MRILLVPLAFSAIILPGIGHGHLTDRWCVSKELEEYTQRLANVPMDIQDWQGEDLETDPQQTAVAGLTGYVSRRYTHRTSRTQITVLVGCGRAGPVSVHTPDICYVGSGYKMSNAETKFSLKNPNPSLVGEFREASFMKADPTPRYLEVYWSWNCKGAWEIPDYPRLAFGLRRALYKMYVICPYSRENQRKEAQDACKSFFDVLVPVLKNTLF